MLVTKVALAFTEVVIGPSDQLLQYSGSHVSSLRSVGTVSMCSLAAKCGSLHAPSLAWLYGTPRLAVPAPTTRPRQDTPHTQHNTKHNAENLHNYTLSVLSTIRQKVIHGDPTYALNIQPLYL